MSDLYFRSLGCRTFNAVALCVAVGLAQAAQAFPVALSSAPENDLALTVSAIESARESIFLNIYELSSPDIANALMNRIRAGVHVEILEEGSPVGGISTGGKGIQNELVQAMNSACGGDRFYEMSSRGGKRRFRWDHAKYAVIDRRNLLIGSENYSPTGNPAPGAVGNRGWEVFIGEPQIASQFLSMFASDSNPANPDIQVLTSSRSTAGCKSPVGVGASRLAAGAVYEATAAQMVISPETSLNGLVALIHSARSSIDVQQMEFDSQWGAASSPLVDALVEASRRGVRVRVLINDDRVFAHPGKPFHSKNRDTVDVLNRAGIRAQIANLRAMGVDYIHNKGALVDGRYTLVSSINWNQNSVQNNREAAVVIDSAPVFAYFEPLFERDWQVSGGAANISLNPPFTSIRQDLSPRVQPAVSSAALQCPNQIELTAQVGPLQIDDSKDAAFALLSNKTLHEVFVRQEGSRGCVLGSAIGSLEIGNKKFLELREGRNSVFLILEGYVGETHQVFSIRSTLPKSRLTGVALGNVYEGSGARQKLGSAMLNLKVMN